MDVNRFDIGDAMVWKLVLPPPPPMKTRTDLGTLDFNWHRVSPPNLCGSWCVETNRCIPQVYRLVLSVIPINDLSLT